MFQRSVILLLLLVLGVGVLNLSRKTAGPMAGCVPAEHVWNTQIESDWQNMMEDTSSFSLSDVHVSNRGSTLGNGYLSFEGELPADLKIPEHEFLRVTIRDVSLGLRSRGLRLAIEPVKGSKKGAFSFHTHQKAGISLLLHEETSSLIRTKLSGVTSRDERRLSISSRSPSSLTYNLEAAFSDRKFLGTYNECIQAKPKSNGLLFLYSADIGTSPNELSDQRLKGNKDPSVKLFGKVSFSLFLNKETLAARHGHGLVDTGNKSNPAEVNPFVAKGEGLDLRRAQISGISLTYANSSRNRLEEFSLGERFRLHPVSMVPVGDTGFYGLKRYESRDVLHINPFSKELLNRLLERRDSFEITFGPGINIGGLDRYSGYAAADMGTFTRPIRTVNIKGQLGERGLTLIIKADLDPVKKSSRESKLSPSDQMPAEYENILLLNWETLLLRDIDVWQQMAKYVYPPKAEPTGTSTAP